MENKKVPLKIQRGFSWLTLEMEKDNKEIINNKTKLINEIKQIDRSEIFKPRKKEIGIAEIL